MTAFELRSIGVVQSSLVDVASAPRQPDEGAPAATLIFRPEVLEGIKDLHVGEEVILVTWLHRARREILSVHPRDDPERPRLGVFSTRSSDRPNPIGLHRVEIIRIDGDRVQVRHLEAVDGTPILDVKPVLDADIARR